MKKKIQEKERHLLPELQRLYFNKTGGSARGSLLEDSHTLLQYGFEGEETIEHVQLRCVWEQRVDPLQGTRSCSLPRVSFQRLRFWRFSCQITLSLPASASLARRF